MFFLAYTPTSSSDDIPPSNYYIATRTKAQEFTFSKLPEVSAPFGKQRPNPYQFVARLRNFEPYLTDALIVLSTASTDVGLLTRSAEPLASGAPTNVFTATVMDNDSLRATLPMSSSMDDTTTIGLALDLSSRDTVSRPIPGEEMENSPTPLPNLMALNEEGVLASWWVVYVPSLQQGKAFSGLAISQPDQGSSSVSGSAPAVQQSAAPSQPTAAAPASTSAFGKPSFGAPAFGAPAALGSSPSPFGAPKPAFGSTSSLGGAFGANSQAAAPAFGSPSTIGSTNSQSATPAFGSTSKMGPASSQSASPAFGSTSTLGSAGPAFGSVSKPTFGATLSFGQSSGAVGNSQPAFGSTSSIVGQSSGFGKFASTSAFAQPGPSTAISPFATVSGNTSGSTGFGSAGGSSAPASNIFGQKSQSSAFGSGGSLAGSSTSTAFGNAAPKAQDQQGGLFGSGGFKLNSTFKGDGSAKDDLKPGSSGQGSGSFGFSLGDTLTDASNNSEAMDEAEDREPEVTTPGPFGSLSKPTTTPANSSFFPSTTPKETPFKNPFMVSETPRTPAIKAEPEDDTATPVPSRISEPPLPPDPTSRAAYAAGDTSASSNQSPDDAPLPPDFLAPTSMPKETTEPEPALPEGSDEEGEGDYDEEESEEEGEEEEHEEDEEEEGEDEEGQSEFEDSGEDVTKDFEPTEEVTTDSLQSPESSFGAHTVYGKQPNIFGNNDNGKSASRLLFGEVGKPPVFPIPKAREGPRSPSPIRPTSKGSLGPNRLQSLSRPDVARSVSMPGGRPGFGASSLSQAARVQQARESSAEEIRNKEIGRREEQLAAEYDEFEQVGDELDDVHQELQRPVSPSPELGDLLIHQELDMAGCKLGLPGQIEKLYRDVNLMVELVGLNARTLASFITYHDSNPSLEERMGKIDFEMLAEIDPDTMYLDDLTSLSNFLSETVTSVKQGLFQDPEEIYQQCTQFVSRDITLLRNQLSSLRKTLDSRNDHITTLTAPLSTEQAALQHDLRKSATALQTRVADVEKAITLLRARLTDHTPISSNGDSSNGTPTRNNFRKPTVEAVQSTISKMTSMAEKKSSDLAVLEAQLKRLGLDSPTATRENSPFVTPIKDGRRRSILKDTTPGPEDGALSTYHTPQSIRSTRGVRFEDSVNGWKRPGDPGVLLSAGETEKYKSKVQRKIEVNGMLKNALLKGGPRKARGLDE